MTDSPSTTTETTTSTPAQRRRNVNDRADHPRRAPRSEQLSRLNALHAEYVERINRATRAGRDDSVDGARDGLRQRGDAAGRRARGTHPPAPAAAPGHRPSDCAGRTGSAGSRASTRSGHPGATPPEHLAAPGRLRRTGTPPSGPVASGRTRQGVCMCHASRYMLVACKQIPCSDGTPAVAGGGGDRAAHAGRPPLRTRHPEDQVDPSTLPARQAADVPRRRCGSPTSPRRSSSTPRPSAGRSSSSRTRTSSSAPPTPPTAAPAWSGSRPTGEEHHAGRLPSPLPPHQDRARALERGRPRPAQDPSHPARRATCATPTTSTRHGAPRMT